MLINERIGINMALGETNKHCENRKNNSAQPPGSFLLQTGFKWTMPRIWQLRKMPPTSIMYVHPFLPFLWSEGKRNSKGGIIQTEMEQKAADFCPRWHDRSWRGRHGELSQETSQPLFPDTKRFCSGREMWWLWNSCQVMTLIFHSMVLPRYLRGPLKSSVWVMRIAGGDSPSMFHAGQCVRECRWEFGSAPIFFRTMTSFVESKFCLGLGEHNNSKNQKMSVASTTSV